MSETPLLSVEGLSVRSSAYPDGKTLVDNLSFELGAERIGLVGESGSGKSLTARALMGLLQAPLEVRASRLEFGGQDLRRLTPRQWRPIRGAGMAMVLQDPRHALNPVLSIGAQIEESLRLHQKLSAAERRDRVFAMMEAVGLPEPHRLWGAYPRHLSGGMGQRAMLAIMLINEPRLLIADEPTSALDVVLRDHVLELITNLVDTRRMGLLLISHDLRQVARYCDRALVMFQGRIVDVRRASELDGASHPYTRTLWACRPSADTYGTMLPELDRNQPMGAMAP
jgi:peptide/nickel transport system ATP-binding protein